MRVENQSRAISLIGDAGPNGVVIEAGAGPTAGQGGVLGRIQPEGTGGPEVVQLGTHRGTVTAVDLEQQALEVGRHLNVHAGRRGGHHLGDVHRPLGEEPGQDVVGIAANHQLGHGQTGQAGHVPGEDVAEIPGGHREGHRSSAATEALGGHHVVDDLGHDPGPVDGVDRREANLVAEGHVGEHGLDQVLAIVERAVHGHVVHVGRLHGRHLSALDV